MTGDRWIAVSWVSFVMLIITWTAAWAFIPLFWLCLIAWPFFIFLIVRRKKR